MESRYKLFVTAAAEADLDAIYAYISEDLHAESAAWSLMERIENEITALCKAPFRCEQSRNESLGQKGYRRLVVKNYVVLYLVDELESAVIIARVFYGAMDYERYI